MRPLILMLVAAGAAIAQVSAPKLGWVPDETRIAPMIGIPGAGQVGVAYLAPDLRTITVSPSQDYVLATLAATGDVWTLVPGSSAMPVEGAGASPDRIVMSPRGSAAALWFHSSGHVQIITGLPSAPAVREIDASLLGAPPTDFAVSDDGQWLAGAWPGAVYTWGPDGTMGSVPVAGAAALAFYTNRSDLALATSSSLLSVTGLGGNIAVSMIAASNSSSAPVGLALSLANGYAVYAEPGGTIHSFNLTTQNVSIFDCGCKPEGVFGVGGGVFRLTSPPSGAVKLFDATSGSIFVLLPSKLEPVARTSTAPAPRATTPLPPVTIGGIPAKTGFQQTVPITVSLASPYPDPLTGTVTLEFTTGIGPNDPMIQFANGTRTASFTIAAGSTQASFSGASSVSFTTGTTAGTITLTLDLKDSTTNADVTPSPAPSATYITSPSVPFVSTVSFSQATGALTVVVTGFSSTRSMTSGLFHFASATGVNASIPMPDVTVQLQNSFQTWYNSATSNQYGTEFTLTVPFTVQGDAFDVVAVTVTLTNTQGNSTPVSPP